MMRRLPDWQLRLEAFARERARMQFAWDVNHCALFAADAVQALTGQLVCPELRGCRTAREALRVLQDIGGVRGLATAALGSPIPVQMAAVGDVVVFESGKREALGICNGGTILAAGVHGTVVVSMRLARAAWRVG